MTDPGYASLCFLSYNRPEFIAGAISSAVRNAGYPCEVIVHDDGSSDPLVQSALLTLLELGEISRLILNPPGHNEGVGTAINRCFHVASGSVLIKLDQDLLFEPGWLAKTVEILKDPIVGMTALFRYWHEPVDWREKKIEIEAQPRGDYHYTSQIIGSAFAVPRTVWLRTGPLEEHSDAFAEDMAYMERIRNGGGFELACPNEDLVTNRGFGIGPSTVVEQGGIVHKIHHEPHVIGRAAPEADALAEMGELLVENTFTAHYDEPLLDGTRYEDLSFEYDWTLPPEVMAGIEIPKPIDLGAISRESLERHDASGEPPFRDRPFHVGVVITTCAGREENLNRALDYVGNLQGARPRIALVVYDGCEPPDDRLYAGDIPIWRVRIRKHAPGQEQPRNVGVSELQRIMPELNYVWFLDSDMVFPHDTLEHFYRGFCAAPEERILIGPYDWMAPGATEPHGVVLQPDYRWASFADSGPEKVFRHDLGTGLACFSGNLIWPIKQFLKIGGYHHELHHGRCEDGELGLRACEHGIPMSLVRDARAWHVWHPIDTTGVLAKNERDVPLLNAMHPWVENEGLLVVDKDGKRFDWKCPEGCGIFNSLSFWDHATEHRAA